MHVVVWGEGGRANKCLRSVSKRTTKLFRTKPAAADRHPHKRHARPQKWWLRGCVPLACQRARRQERGREEAGRDGDA